jgi:hypothetical protein
MTSLESIKNQKQKIHPRERRGRGKKSKIKGQKARGKNEFGVARRFFWLGYLSLCGLCVLPWPGTAAVKEIF